MAQQGSERARTVTLQELGLTGDAWGPLAISAIVFLVAAVTGIIATRPAWYVLGVGRPFLPEAFMLATAFALLLITTGGLTVAWTIGTVGLLTLWEVLGKSTTFATVRRFSGLSLVVVWAFVGIYIHIYGVPRPEIESQVLARSESLHYALYTFHRFNDLMHFAFAVGALWFLWGYGDRLLHSRFAQVLTLSLLWLTFFSLSLTVGLHSALVRF